MAEKRDNSVLFSLRELRDIEDERVAEEDEAARRAEEERLRSEEEAERQRIEAEEAAKRAVEEAERRAREEKERLEREQQLRLEEAERKAQIEAQAKIEQQRLHMEMEVKKVAAAAKNHPKSVIGIATVLVVALGGFGIYQWKASEEAAQQALIAKKEAEAAKEAQKRMATELATLNDEYDERFSRLEQDLKNAETKERREEIKRKLAAERAQKLKDMDNIKRRAGKKNKGPKPSTAPKCKDGTDDPLCGL